MSAQVRRLADLGARHAFLRTGFGWGHMTLHMVKDGIGRGAMVKIRMQVHPAPGQDSMRAIYMKDEPPGPAGRRFVDRLKNREMQEA